VSLEERSGTSEQGKKRATKNSSASFRETRLNFLTWPSPTLPRLSLVSSSLLPRVFTARELFNATECKQLIAAAVNGAKGGAGPFVFRPDENAVIGEAVKRASELVKLPEELATDVVFRRYREGEGLEAHVDAVDPRRDPKYVGSNNRNRFATVLVYLSAVTREQGGETIFNRGRGGDAGDGCGRGLRVSPGLGGAMVFYSLCKSCQTPVPGRLPCCSLFCEFVVMVLGYSIFVSLVLCG
jgi:hypothetical protein